MPRKNPHAVSLGRRGGRVNSAAQRQARARNARLGGRPSLYRLVHWSQANATDVHLYSTPRDGTILQRWEGDHWVTLEPPLDAAARKYLSRHR